MYIFINFEKLNNFHIVYKGVFGLTINFKNRVRLDYSSVTL